MSFPSLHLRYSSFSNPSVAFYLRHSSFSNPSVASSTSQLILQPLFRCSYVAGSSLTSPGEPPVFHVKKNMLQIMKSAKELRSFSHCCLETEERQILQWLFLAYYMISCSKEIMYTRHLIFLHPSHIMIGLLAVCKPWNKIDRGGDIYPLLGDGIHPSKDNIVTSTTRNSSPSRDKEDRK